MKITWRQLRQYIDGLRPNQLDQGALILQNDLDLAAIGFDINQEHDPLLGLQPNQPILFAVDPNEATATQSEIMSDLERLGLRKKARV